MPKILKPKHSQNSEKLNLHNLKHRHRNNNSLYSPNKVRNDISVARMRYKSVINNKRNTSTMKPLNPPVQKQRINLRNASLRI